MVQNTHLSNIDSIGAEDEICLHISSVQGEGDVAAGLVWVEATGSYCDMLYSTHTHSPLVLHTEVT